MTRSKLTSTRLATMRRCPRQHRFRYELRWQWIRETAPLRLGTPHPRGQAVAPRGIKFPIR